MKYVAFVIPVVLSIISLLLVLSNSLFHINDYNFVIGVLSLLVTILIGWQIFNVISFESRLYNQKEIIKKYLEENTRNVEKKLSKKYDDLDRYLHFHELITYSQFSFFAGDKSKSLETLFLACDGVFLITNEEQKKTTENIALNLIIQFLDSNKDILLSGDQYELYSSIISNFDDKRKIEIITQLFEIKKATDKILKKQ